MNTRVLTLSMSVAHDVSTFAITHGVSHSVTIDNIAGYVVELRLINPFLVTKLQDTLFATYHHDHFAMIHEVAK